DYYGPVSHDLGLLAASCGRFAEAERHFAAALEMNARMETPALAAETQHEYARMLLARGDEVGRERASALLDSAFATARKLGMLNLEEKIATLQDEPGRAARAVEVGHVEPLGCLRREGDFWTISHGRDAFRLRDVRGLHYLRHLVQHPGRE